MFKLIWKQKRPLSRRNLFLFLQHSVQTDNETEEANLPGEICSNLQKHFVQIHIERKRIHFPEGNGTFPNDDQFNSVRIPDEIKMFHNISIKQTNLVG